MVDGLRALAFVGTRSSLRTLTGLSQRPWLVFSAALGLLLLLAVQGLALRAADTGTVVRPEWVEVASTALLLLLAAVAAGGTLGSPLRLRLPDVTWVLTSPGGPRALLTWHLLVGPLRFAVVGGTATALTRLRLGLPLRDAAAAAVAAGVLGLALRLVSYGGHVLALPPRGPGLVRTSAAVVAGAAVVAQTGLVTGPQVLVEPVARGVLDPAAASVLVLTAILVALAVSSVLLVRLARGFEPAAAEMAWQMSALSGALSGSGGGIAGIAAGRFRTDLRSLTAGPRWQAERALLYRAWAHQRRLLRADLAQAAGAAALAAVLVVVDDRLAALPAALLLALMLPGAVNDTLPQEYDHQHLVLAPFRPARALAWAAVLPAARITLMLGTAWLPVAASDAVPAGLWWSGVIAAPVLGVLLTGAGALAATVAGGLVPRLLGVALLFGFPALYACAVPIAYGVGEVTGLVGGTLAVMGLSSATAWLALARGRAFLDRQVQPSGAGA